MEEQERTVGEIIYDAVEEMVERSDYNGVVVKAAFIADIVNEDGDRILIDQYVTDGGRIIATHWDAKGMLSDALSQYDRTRGRSG